MLETEAYQKVIELAKQEKISKSAMAAKLIEDGLRMEDFRNDMKKEIISGGGVKPKIIIK